MHCLVLHQFGTHAAVFRNALGCQRVADFEINGSTMCTLHVGLFVSVLPIRRLALEQDSLSQERDRVFSVVRAIYGALFASRNSTLKRG